MADDADKLRNKFILKLLDMGVQLSGPTNKWHITKTYSKPEGFEFACSNPQMVQDQADRSKKLVTDFDYPTPAGLDKWPNSVGFTEIGEGARVHLDVGIESFKFARVFIDPHGTVVGREKGTGLALRDLKGPVVTRVKNFAQDRGINLDNYGIRVVRIYDNGPEPPGIDFRCADPKRLWALYVLVKSLKDRFKLDDPNDKTEGGWFNQLFTHGSGFREKGDGPRLHVELAPDENLGNVHIDSHAYVREDGSNDWQEALTHHGPLDLVSGFLGGRIGPFTWLPFGSLTYMRDGEHETTVVGLPDEHITQPGDGGRGWRVMFGIRFTFPNP